MTPCAACLTKINPPPFAANPVNGGGFRLIFVFLPENREEMLAFF